MKKYAIHFVYILVIVTLAVMSRMKTNELTKELTEAKAIANESHMEALRAAEMAEKAAHESRAAAEIARAQVVAAQKALEKCK